MEAAQIMEYLGREYGIRSREELDEAASAMQGIDLGIFTLPIWRKSARTERKDGGFSVASASENSVVIEVKYASNDERVSNRKAAV